MTSDRPLLPPSPTPPPPPLSALPDPQPEPPLRPPDPPTIPRQSSLRNSASSRSRSAAEPSGAGSARFSIEVTPLPRSGTRYGSRRGDSEGGGFGSSRREISDEEARLIFIDDPSKTNERVEFAGNSIRTSKYSVLTFLPRNLYEQFHRVAYIYFLIIAILNQLPQLAVFGRATSILPLAFVLLVSAVKDAYEDYRRHRSDRIENNRTALVLSDNAEFHTKRWKHIRVGDIIKINANETLPCDMVLLSTADPTGVAYVQTINLDGESNLKTRYAKQETMKAMDPERPRLSGSTIKCEKPNRNIYGFYANMEIDGKRVSLGPSNIILRGCELKNTSWAIGVAVYCGRETKVMLNSSGAPSKRSRLEVHMNREIILLSLFLVFLCSLVSILAGVWLGNHRDELNYLQYYHKRDYSDGNDDKYKYYGIGFEVFFTFLSSVIVFQIMIPISLYISMELVRLGQAYFMIRDDRLYDVASGSRFQCRALNINEDLGQIKYVFSDKTGTLTENKMVFRCASVRGIDYSGAIGGDGGYSVSVDGQVVKPKVTVKTDPELVKLLQSETEEGKHAFDFFLALSACNTIVPLIVETSDPSLGLMDYQGESPDEQALVYAAAAYGFMLIERTSGHIIIDILGERQRFDVLGLHEFDSDRKRMSVIIGCPDKSVKLLVKGADSAMFTVIEKFLNADVVRSTETHLHAYASMGLRTLVVGIRELSSADFEEWQSTYEKASTALFGRSSKLRAVAANIEQNLRLLGASGIEDKLQEGVPEAIESMRQAGIKVWVLTGDKQETAISIGYSCKLLTSNMTQIIINIHSKEACRKSLEDAMDTVKKIQAMSSGPSDASGGRDSVAVPIGLIIDGTSLVYILETELEEELFKVATECNVVLCCRVAPLQKAGIVALIKNRTDDMTLAIGDGANDVSMIQMADVGIGISGQEGRQAVMASDFAMGQFRFLVPLLLVHGHWNYQRMAYMILYNFYRNVVLVLVLFWYVLYTAFSLTTAINEWSSVLYSVIYSSVPTIVVGILDKDLGRRTLLKYPSLYGAGQRGERYNLGLFLWTMLDTVWQSAVIFFIPFLAYRHSTIDGSSIGDLWTLAVVILVNLHLAMDVFRWNWITHVAIWGSIVATCICVFIIDAIPDLPGFRAIFHEMGTRLFWACLFSIILLALIPRFIVKAFDEYMRPSDIQISREMEKLGTAGSLAPVEVELNQISDAQRGTAVQ
ncbi:Phospholipid-transporting ATPase 1 [Acorus gramineus]|uniref:Phospholipid-transporting ATPase n=1 Tax=Acorus gramineus TaxID=55184 RepID=A0AAV9BY48_ACOGR|nr:Phospholipid-transporting ATPase 1 [Acorus gramineus]